MLGVEVGRLDGRVGQLSALSQRSGLEEMVQAALLEPGHTTVALTTPGARRRAAVLVITPGGSAFALVTGMPALDSGRTYQLWGFVHGRPHQPTGRRERHRGLSRDCRVRASRRCGESGYQDGKRCSRTTWLTEMA